MAGKISAFFGAQDMTAGNPTSNLIRFSVPLLIGNLAQQLYSLSLIHISEPTRRS